MVSSLYLSADEKWGNDVFSLTVSGGMSMSKKRIIRVDKADLHKIQKYGSSTFSNITIQLVPDKIHPCIEVHGGIIE